MPIVRILRFFMRSGGSYQSRHYKSPWPDLLGIEKFGLTFYSRIHASNSASPDSPIITSSD